MKNNFNKFFPLDKHCKLCAKELEKLDKIETRRKGVYANMELTTHKRIKTKVVFTPDYNASGILTHWHIWVVK